MVIKINFRIITKNRTADPEIEFITKSILKPYGRAAAMPKAWELKFCTRKYIIACSYQIGVTTLKRLGD